MAIGHGNSKRKHILGGLPMSISRGMALTRKINIDGITWLSALTWLVCAMGTEMLAADALTKLSVPYKHLKYNNLNGYVAANGNVKRVPLGRQSTAYNAIGCSGFVVPVLNRYIYGKEWKEHQSQNWSLYQQYASDIAAAFDLPLTTELSSEQINSPLLVQQLIANGTIAKGGKFLFDTRLGVAGHTGFVEANADGTLTTHMFSGIGKGIAANDKTYDPNVFPEKKLAQRSKKSGYTTGNFADWYNASQYRSSPVQLFELPEGYILEITYSWPSGEMDLDTGTTFEGITVGYAYPENVSNAYLTWSLDNTGAGPEFVKINIQKALEKKVIRRGQTFTVELAAGWFQPAGGSGPATVEATLYLSDEIISTSSKFISPGVQVGQATTSVGTVTVNLNELELTLE
jgi:hypothetical protein